jgi:tRNA nucleotidyltransferase/poly(A) polymerase
MLETAREVLAGEEAWVVGGAVRDELLGRELVDLDIAVRDPRQAARAFA